MIKIKILNFTAKEVLPALLDKAKCQTIRPAWKYSTNALPDGSGFEKWILPKPPRFKVGEKIQLMWNQRSKYSIFCDKCGDGLDSRNVSHILKCGNFNHFNKLLGTGEITEIFKIRMWIGNDAPLIDNYSLKDTYELAKRDGFKSDNKYVDFYNFFSRYALHDPKEFWVYRWR